MLTYQGPSAWPRSWASYSYRRPHFCGAPVAQSSPSCVAWLAGVLPALVGASTDVRLRIVQRLDKAVSVLATTGHWITTDDPVIYSAWHDCAHEAALGPGSSTVFPGGDGDGDVVSILSKGAVVAPATASDGRSDGDFTPPQARLDVNATVSESKGSGSDGDNDSESGNSCGGCCVSDVSDDDEDCVATNGRRDLMHSASTKALAGTGNSELHRMMVGLRYPSHADDGGCGFKFEGAEHARIHTA